MITPALVAALLAAVLVLLRSHDLAVAVEHEPTSARARRRQLIFETWVLTGPALALVVAPTLS